MDLKSFTYDFLNKFSKLIKNNQANVFRDQRVIHWFIRFGNNN